jgi:heavy metal sensor kinase
VLKAMSLRLRLTLLSVALVGITLGVIGVALYFYIERASYEQVDGELSARTAEVPNTLTRPMLQRLGIGTLDLPDPTGMDTPQIYIQLLDTTGVVRAVSSNIRSGTFPVEADDMRQAVQRQQTVASSFTLDSGTRMRALYTPVTQDRQVVGVIQAIRSLANLDRNLDQTRLLLLATGVLALTLVGFGAWWTTGRTLRTVDSIAATARRIELSQDLSQRIPHLPDAPDDEMSRLVYTFNNMLARLDATFQAQKQFVADSSHELRSPLTVIKGNLELWRKARSEEDRQIAAAAIEQETARMTRLVENLLFLAQMEATPVRSAQPVLREPVELDSLLLMVYQQARAIGRGHQITLAHEDVVTVQGDRDQLQQLLLNLVDNAIKYTPTGGTISLGLYGAGDWARLEVSDTGIGIPTDDLPHIFDRFYRSDKARSRTMGGAGLGLAIVREVAEAHGGRVEVFSTPGEGTLFRVWLPRQAGQAALPDPAPGEALGLAFLPDEIPALPPGNGIEGQPVAPLLGRSSDEIRRGG